MHDFRCVSAADMFYRELKDSVAHFKETKGGQYRMSQAMEERIAREREEAKTEGRIEGRIDTLFETMKGLMRTMQISAEQAMTAMCITEDDRAVLSKKFTGGQ